VSGVYVAFKSQSPVGTAVKARVRVPFSSPISAAKSFKTKQALNLQTFFDTVVSEKS
jgi:hypothetical protein